MTALTTRRRGARRGRAGADCERSGVGRGSTPAPTLFDVGSGPTGGEPTLDELVSGAWEGLAARRRVSCPVCAGEMVPAEGAHPQVAAGRCERCQTTLS